MENREIENRTPFEKRKRETSSFPSIFSFFLYTPDFWRGCTTFPPCNFVIGRGIALIYVFELSFYLQV